MSKHPNNGPTFSKPTIKKIRSAARSPARNQAAQEQAASDAAKQRRFRQLFREDRDAWFNEYFKKDCE
jgi:hypothetical protein